jgi:hypothetical protein
MFLGLYPMFAHVLNPMEGQSAFRDSLEWSFHRRCHESLISFPWHPSGGLVPHVEGNDNCKLENLFNFG